MNKDDFKIYKIQYTGERTKLDIKPEDLQNYLNPEQVLIIMREDLRRIYIWTGWKSRIRKRFVSSRHAQELQRDLIQDSQSHRCKIVSIDQGDELQEFLDAFGLEPMELPESVYEKKKKDLRDLLRDERRKRDKDGDRFPYPYVFKPPSPPDDLALAPRTQLRQPPKKKDTEEKIHCQYCGMELTEEEQFTHSCKKKPKNK